MTGNRQQKLFPALRGIHSKRRLQLVYSDVCGLMPNESIGRNRYFVTLVEDYSMSCSVYFLKSVAEFPDKF